MTLQQWMDAKGWKDAEVAKKLGGISRSQVSRIRRNGTRSLPTAQRFAALTKLPVEAFAPRGVA